MGSCLSCRSSTTKLKNIRVVHLNGYVEDFEDSVTVSQVTGTTPKHCLWTRAQLLSSSSKPLRPDTVLEPGQIYFLLSYSAIYSDASPMDLANTVHHLTTIGKTTKFVAKNVTSNQFSKSDEAPTSVKSENCAKVPCRGARSWKPILDTIREISFNRRSESDLQDK